MIGTRFWNHRYLFRRNPQFIKYRYGIYNFFRILMEWLHVTVYPARMTSKMIGFSFWKFKFNPNLLPKIQIHNRNKIKFKSDAPLFHIFVAEPPFQVG